MDCLSQSFNFCRLDSKMATILGKIQKLQTGLNTSYWWRTRLAMQAQVSLLLWKLQSWPGFSFSFIFSGRSRRQDTELSELSIQLNYLFIQVASTELYIHSSCYFSETELQMSMVNSWSKKPLYHQVDMILVKCFYKLYLTEYIFMRFYDLQCDFCMEELWNHLSLDLHVICWPLSFLHISLLLRNHWHKTVCLKYDKSICSKSTDYLNWNVAGINFQYTTLWGKIERKQPLLISIIDIYHWVDWNLYQLNLDIQLILMISYMYLESYGYVHISVQYISTPGELYTVLNDLTVF